MAITTSDAGKTLAAIRWSGTSKRRRKAVGAALAAARAASATCYGSDVQRKRARAGWVTRRAKQKRVKP